MFYKDILVPVPEKKRIRKNNGPAYVYEVLKRKGPNSKKDVVKCVGIAVNETEMNPNENYFLLHEDMRAEQPLGEETVFENQIYIGANLMLRKIGEMEGLLPLMKEVFREKSELIFSLLEYYLIRRDSVAQLYKYYRRNHYSELNYIPSESTISRLFTDYLDHEIISEFCQEWMKRRVERMGRDSVIDIDFDSTNYNVSSRGVTLSEFGEAKVKEGLPQVNVAYFLDRKTGIPIYFDLYYGSIIDMTHCQRALEKIQTIKKDVRGSFVMDRGYFSMANLQYFEENGFDYLCMGKSNTWFKEYIEKHPPEEMGDPRNRVFSTYYGIHFKGRTFKEDSKERHVYLFYNEGDISRIYTQKQDYVEYCASNLVGKKDEKGGIRNTYGGFIDLTLDENNVITEATPNYDYLKNFKKECGYFWVVTTEDTTPKEILNSYRHRSIIEKQFEFAKSGADLNKTYASSDTAFEAKTFMGFMAAILRAAIIVKLRPYFLQYSNETSQTVLLELDKIKAEKLNDRYLLRCALTARQKQILSHFDLRTQDVFKLIDDLNFTMDLTPKF